MAVKLKMRGSFPVAVRSNMSGFVWYFLLKIKKNNQIKKKNRPGSLFPLLTRITASSLHARDDASSPAFSSYDWRCVCVCMCVFSGILMCVKCLICKCNANAPYQSALSHLEEGVEIIHESCHLSRSLSNLSVELWRKKKKKEKKKNPLVRVEKLNRIHQFSLFFFFFPPLSSFYHSWGVCFLWEPRYP